jgi:hypothetical protein
MRLAQQKYEETLGETESLMLSLNDKEVERVLRNFFLSIDGIYIYVHRAGFQGDQLTDLLTFLEAEVDYYNKASTVLNQLKTTIMDK